MLNGNWVILTSKVKDRGHGCSATRVYLGNGIQACGTGTGGLRKNQPPYSKEVPFATAASGPPAAAIVYGLLVQG